jgi:hypothetical protein
MLRIYWNSFKFLARTMRRSMGKFPRDFLHERFSDACQQWTWQRRHTGDRGRDGCCQPPPAQIRTCPIRAYGSYLEYLTAKRCCGQG